MIPPTAVLEGRKMARADSRGNAGITTHLLAIWCHTQRPKHRTGIGKTANREEENVSLWSVTGCQKPLPIDIKQSHVVGVVTRKMREVSRLHIAPHESATFDPPNRGNDKLLVAIQYHVGSVPKRTN